jgi:hypothetical protein
MDIKDFIQKIDNRELHGESNQDVWDAAWLWADTANSNDDDVQWGWDCGFKLDYDGSICTISSRFYPPHKSSEDYNKWHGWIIVYVLDDEVSRKKIESDTLEDLKISTELYVSGMVEKLKVNIKELLK